MGWNRGLLGGTGVLALLLLMAGCRSPEGVSGGPGRQAVEPPRDTQPPSEARPADAFRLPFAQEQSMALGESVGGRPIEMYVFGEGGETTLVIGGIHGSEPTSSDVAVELVRHLAEHPELYAGRCVMIAPAVNPDGLVARRRTNARGIDINRNFPARNFPSTPTPRFAGGRRPLSEPESNAIATAIEHARPAKIISIHSIPRGRHGNNFDGPGRALAEEMSRCNGYPVLPTMGYPTPGSLGSWVGVDQGVPIITLELPREADADTCWRENREALLAAIRFGAGVARHIDPPVFGK